MGRGLIRIFFRDGILFICRNKRLGLGYVFWVGEVSIVGMGGFGGLLRSWGWF